MSTLSRTSPYDQYAVEYAAYVALREQHGPEADPMGILPHLLDLLGDVTDQQVLDAGCGQGYLARILAARGARVTGVDLSPRLVDQARANDPDGRITYRVADLSTPHAEYQARFDAVASYMVLNDVDDYRGFAATLAQALKPGGRAVLAFNNPYATVVRKGLASSYFASGTTHLCGLSRSGVPVPFYHRTLGEYLDAFLAAGLQLTNLLDVDHPAVAELRSTGQPLADHDALPRFMALRFARP
jgi:2-polyprenyl-3-methyl-5-hydroxy-6-metoxy-1,4-benzoquinol methylase